MTLRPIPSGKGSARFWSVLPLVLALLNLVVAGIYVSLRVANVREQRRLERVQQEQREVEQELARIRTEVQALQARSRGGR